MLSYPYPTNLVCWSNLLIEILQAFITCQLLLALHIFFANFPIVFVLVLVCCILIARHLKTRITRGGVWGSLQEEELLLFFYKLRHCFFSMLVSCKFFKAFWEVDYKGRNARKLARGGEKGCVKTCKKRNVGKVVGP